MRVTSENEPAVENLRIDRRTLRTPCRRWIDAAVDLHVFIRRCHRQVHRRDLFRRPVVVSARLRGAVGAVAADLAPARSVRDPGKAAPATAPGFALDARSCRLLPGDGLSA